MDYKNSFWWSVHIDKEILRNLKKLKFVSVCHIFESDSKHDYLLTR
jgi:hypothetical protein